MQWGMGHVTSIMSLGNCMNFKIIEVKDVFGRVVGEGREEARELFRQQITKSFMCQAKEFELYLEDLRGAVEGF